MSLTDTRHAWLHELLADCDESGRMSEWEDNFVCDIRARYDRFGPDMHLSPRQIEVLERIEEKIHAAG